MFTPNQTFSLSGSKSGRFHSVAISRGWLDVSARQPLLAVPKVNNQRRYLTT